MRNLRAAATASPGVRAAREQEAAIEKIAREVDKERKRARKGKTKHGAEVVAQVEAVIELGDAVESKRKIRTHSGKPASLSAIREGALKRAELGFGADAPVHIRCAHCKDVKLTKESRSKRRLAGTAARSAAQRSESAKRTWATRRARAEIARMDAAAGRAVK